MKIKRLRLVDEEDLKDLQRSIEFCIRCIDEGVVAPAITTLEKMNTGLKKTLKENEDE